MEVIKVDVHCLASRNDDPVNAMYVIWVVTRVPGTFQFIIRHIPAFCKNAIINVKQSFNNASLSLSMSVIWSKFIQFVLNLFATVFFQIKASLYISPDCLFCTSSAFTSETGFPICRGPMDVFFKSQVPQKMRNCLTSYLIIIIVMILIMLIVIISQTYCPQIKASKNLFLKDFLQYFKYYREVFKLESNLSIA